jgi:Protein of unknown function (DUF4013)
MEIGKLVQDSFGYAKEGLFGNVGTWIVLIILTILPVIPILLSFLFFVPSLMTGTMPDFSAFIGVFIVAVIAAIILSAFYVGYQMKILRGETPLPAVSGYGKLFSDGIRYLVIQLIYAIPVLIILAVTIGGAIMTAVSAGPNFEDLLPIIGGVIAGIIIALIVGIIIDLFAVIGLIRFARTGSMGEAFNFGAILGTIRRIGWGHYILSLIVVVILVVIVSIVLGVIPYIGWLLQLIAGPFIAVFYSRYLSLLYDSGEAGAVPVAETGA